jgi:hypothetical protein
MYFIIRIVFNEQGKILTVQIVDHAKGILIARQTLDKAVQNYIQEQYGSQTLETLKFFEIPDVSQITDPGQNGVYAYRLLTNPEQCCVYRHTTKMVPGYFYGITVQTEFLEIARFYMVEHLGEREFHDILEQSHKYVQDSDMVSIGPACVKIPKIMTISPMKDLILELKNNARFKDRYFASENDFSK